MKQHQKTVFFFRRDLRLEDNLGLLTALDASEEVLPAFVFDPRQTDPEKNEYFSAPAFNFLLNSLAELNEALAHRGSQLYVFSGDPAAITESLITQDDIDAVYVNKDYTPFARTRDKEIADICEKYDVAFARCDDLTLSPIEDIRTGQDKIYTVFTPFMRNAATYDVPEPHKNNYQNYYVDRPNTQTATLTTFNVSDKVNSESLILHGGRGEALAILAENDYLKQYKEQRNFPAQRGTSRLSAHHKFGTISIRESYHMAASASGKGSHFISELYWRDFYYYIAYHFPIVFTQSFLPWAKNLDWVNDKEQFTAWCEGKTGVPMVDAAMRELNHTGWIHNRSRMIVASYLTKNLLINWQWGERYFATKLIDYDPAQNNGGWQWSASTGADPRPLRIFNPFTQATKYDPDAVYIKKLIPELHCVSDEQLTDGKTTDFSEIAENYPAPLVDQKESYHRAMATHKKAKETWKAQQSKHN
jgi:deoxyribodipyrimidine photo-lyase